MQLINVSRRDLAHVIYVVKLQRISPVAVFDCHCLNTETKILRYFCIIALKICSFIQKFINLGYMILTLLWLKLILRRENLHSPCSWVFNCFYCLDLSSDSLRSFFRSLSLIYKISWGFLVYNLCNFIFKILVY